MVVQNEMMVHRGEANGPLDQQIPTGLAFDTVFTGDASDREHWLLKNGDDVIARHHTDELRFLVHWSAEVFSDLDELKKNMDGSDDLTIDKAIDMLVDDLASKGIKLDVPSAPLHDPGFIGALNAAYDIGGPARLPGRGPDQRLPAGLNRKALHMDRFTDRKVIVTGAGSGIGAATVARLLDEGATVVACDVSADGLAATAAAADEAGTGKRLTTAVLDVSSEEDVMAAVDAAVAELGGLDVLVNVAAIQRCAHTHEQRWPTGTRTLAVNLTGTFLMTRQALPALLESGRGVVVNFTSTAASFAHPYMAAYAASKGGILSFTHSLALEYSKQGLRAVNIQPGGVVDRAGQQHPGQDARRLRPRPVGQADSAAARRDQRDPR